MSERESRLQRSDNNATWWDRRVGWHVWLSILVPSHDSSMQLLVSRQRPAAAQLHSAACARVISFVVCSHLQRYEVQDGANAALAS
jgi:hypothetical protein